MLHTGGTLGMNLQGAPEDGPRFLETLRQHASRAFELADISVEIVLNKDSSNISPADWITIGRRIHDRMSEWDAFVVTHGTDTMSFTAAALSFMLEGLPKPVVLTGSQRPLTDPHSDAPRNFISAVEIAASGRIKEVSIFFDSLLLRGNRAKKVSVPSFGAFESPNFQPLAKTGMKTVFTPEVMPPPARAYRFDPRCETRVLSVPVFPGFDAEMLFPLVERGVRGLVLQAFGPGDIPSGGGAVAPWIRTLTEHGIPTVICSQAVFGGVDLDLYETGRAARDAGAISAGDMTWETCLVKMMLLLGRGLSWGPFRGEFARNLAGELSEGAS